MKEYPLNIHRYADRQTMGERAARDIADTIRARLSQQPEVRMIFAAAPSQAETLATLRQMSDIDWSRVTAFHMDEYLGLTPSASQRFGQWLTQHIFGHLHFKAVNLLTPEEGSQACIERYTQLLNEAPIDIAVMGIGVNGHLAFNDPPVADFGDTCVVKVVELDNTCRQQQVDDQCFSALNEVPTSALTLTIPCLLSAAEIFCVVPGAAKREAVYQTLHGPISTRWPSSVLRTHAACSLYLDADSLPEG
ncbi:6-phosphogluconolactonase [uncultured Pluralibacter sp.]|uniref:6-phosphogluconolactonase n=1 Tax=uncultured Pluralibacter sp. TaxID=1490864 RepID=UPI002605F4CE|nr:6-phosphogluconolactonase [uncultured Pluralibacter sp.]